MNGLLVVPFEQLDVQHNTEPLDVQATQMHLTTRLTEKFDKSPGKYHRYCLQASGIIALKCSISVNEGLLGVSYVHGEKTDVMHQGEIINSSP